MAEKRPLCNYAGTIKELQSGDNLPGASSSVNTSYQQSFISADLSSGILTVTHDLGQQLVMVIVEDNSGKPVIPQDITFTSTNALSVDLSDITVTGTWSVRVIRGLDTDTPAGYSLEFDNGDLSTGILTVTHSLNKLPVSVIVMDNNSKQIVPDDISFTSNNEIEIDLTNYGTLTGTWTALCK